MVSSPCFRLWPEPLRQDAFSSVRGNPRAQGGPRSLCSNSLLPVKRRPFLLAFPDLTQELFSYFPMREDVAIFEKTQNSTFLSFLGTYEKSEIRVSGTLHPPRMQLTDLTCLRGQWVTATWSQSAPAEKAPACPCPLGSRVFARGTDVRRTVRASIFSVAFPNFRGLST